MRTLLSNKLSCVQATTFRLVPFPCAEMVVDHLPSPLQLSPERIEKLMCSSAETFDSFPEQTQQLKQGQPAQY